jgi:PPM family protein phosphatase
MRLKGHGFSVVGSREMNQDSYLIRDDRGIYAVADGVGGGMRGEVASRMAIEGLEKLTESSHEFKKIFGELQARVYKESMDVFGEAVMGTTLTAVGIKGSEMEICHVGDSRCYLYTSALLQQLTEDQDHFDEQLQASVLASYLGIPEDTYPLRIFQEKVLVSPGHRLLLCSDGLYRQLNEVQMATLIKKHISEPGVLVKNLCEEAAKHEYSDNVTVIYVEIE